MQLLIDRTARQAPASNNLAFTPAAEVKVEIATTARQVEEAWRLVYDAYRIAGFIQPNPYGMHAARQGLGDHTAVILARCGDTPVGTITAIADTHDGLPLDSVYGAELRKLRAPGRRLLEIGLFADRRNACGNSFTTLLELMRHAFWFGRARNVTDYVCGIPPRRVKLYRQAFGFQPVGEERSYASVCNNPVQMMHVTMDYVARHHDRHRATNYFMTRPMEPRSFAHRFDFTSGAMSRSRLRYFMDYKHRQTLSPSRRAGA